MAAPPCCAAWMEQHCTFTTPVAVAVAAAVPCWSQAPRPRPRPRLPPPDGRSIGLHPSFCSPSPSPSHRCQPTAAHCQCGVRKKMGGAMIVVGVRRGLAQDGFGDRDRGRKSSSIFIPSAEKKKKKTGGGISFGDQLLDYIEGGPKLRKWYGAPDQLPKDGGSEEQESEEPVQEEEEEEDEEEEEEDEEEDGVRDVVLVTDADSETGQLVVLELILRRLRVRALVKDLKAATAGFGAYVEPVEGDVNDKELLRRVLRGVRAVICPTKVGKLADGTLLQGVEHVVLLSKK